jgi:hypothetical protein
VSTACFWIAFALEASLLCAMGSAVGCTESLWVRQVHTFSTFTCLCPQRQQESKAWGNPWVGQRLGGVDRALSSALTRGRLRDLVTLPAWLNAYRPHSGVYLLLWKRRQWKFCDSEGLDLGPQFPGAHLYAFRPCSIIHLSVRCKRLWVSCDSEGLVRSALT